jgi:hypothetical protein
MKARITLCTNEQNKKIPCIKFYRYLSGKGLKDSKDFIEDLMKEFGNNPSEFIHDTELDREQIEKMMDECQVGGSAQIGEGIDGKFWDIGGGIIHLKINHNNSKIEMELPLSNLGTMIDGFLINSNSAKEMKNEPEQE